MISDLTEADGGEKMEYWKQIVSCPLSPTPATPPLYTYTEHSKSCAMPKGGNSTKPLWKQAVEKASGSPAVWLCVRKAVLEVKHKARARHHHSVNRDRNNTRMRAAHHARGPEVNRAAGALHRERHRDDINAAHKQKYENDPVYRAGFIMRSRMRWAIERVRADKADRSEELLGCTTRQFAAHLGVQCTGDFEGMEVDHIWPIAAYNMQLPEEQHRAFNFQNTRLVTVEENRQKGYRIPDRQLALLVPREYWPTAYADYY
tara:strand:- start:1381 stop:2160 length:780 start_codon:yes stop_codon:yes gene_type:complete